MEEQCVLEDTEMCIVQEQPPEEPPEPRNVTREEYEEYMRLNKPEESILEWFDRAVESELEKHRTNSDLRGETLDLSQGLGHHSVLEGNASGVEIMGALGGDPDTELSDAVEKFAIAESIVAFEGAVRAAEAAAAEAPPELAEEAAAAGARGYQAELTGVVQDQLMASEGCPIEVLGYVGITKPTNPKKSKPKKFF